MSETDEHPQGGTTGGRLRAAREAAGLSIAEIAQQTRVNARHLTAIEEGDNDALPAAPYSVGFVKAYARAVGLDSVSLAAEFRQEFDRANVRTIETVRYEPADPARLPSRMLAWVALLVALVIILGYALWRDGRFTGETSEDQQRIAAAGEPAAPPPPPAAPQPQSASPPEAAAPPPATADGPVLLTAIEPVWLRVYERGGATLFQGELAAGQNYEVPATAADPLIRLGKPEALKVSVGGHEVAPLGPPSRTVKDVSLRGPALLARPAGAPPAARPAPAARTLAPAPTPANAALPSPASDTPAVSP